MIVIPIILSKCHWKDYEFAKLLALPKDGRPLFNSSGATKATLLNDVMEGIRLAVLGFWTGTSDKYGAVVMAGMDLSHARSATLAKSLVLRPTKDKHVPVLIKGLVIDHQAKDAGLRFQIDTGTISNVKGEWHTESQTVVDFFYDTLATHEENLWVNLAPHESNRMLPPVLSGTTLGRAMLEVDLTLKKFPLRFYTLIWNQENIIGASCVIGQCAVLGQTVCRSAFGNAF